MQPDRREHARDSGSSEADAGSTSGRRRQPRAVLDVEAKLRASSKLSISGRLQNLSPGGCCVKLKFGSLAIGDTVWFKMDGIESWMGFVRWFDGALVGIEFERPFYPAVFEHLISLNAQIRIERAA